VSQEQTPDTRRWIKSKNTIRLITARFRQLYSLPYQAICACADEPMDATIICYIVLRNLRFLLIPHKPNWIHVTTHFFT